MIKKSFLAAFLLALLSPTIVGRAWAQTRMPGVVGGNSFTYEVTSFWSSSEPNATIPTKLADINQTEYFQAFIMGVTGADVFLLNKWHFKNGTETSSDGTVNLETGNSTGGFWAIIAANLGVNELLHPAGQDMITVNATVMMNYTGGQRETNHLMLTYLADDFGNSIENVEYYFDKQTGMLVQLRDTTSGDSQNQTTTIFWKIKESNVWVVPEFQSILVLPLFLITTLLAVIAYKKKTGTYPA